MPPPSIPMVAVENTANWLSPFLPRSTSQSPASRPSTLRPIQHTDNTNAAQTNEVRRQYMSDQAVFRPLLHRQSPVPSLHNTVSPPVSHTQRSAYPTPSFPCSYPTAASCIPATLPVSSYLLFRTKNLQPTSSPILPLYRTTLRRRLHRHISATKVIIKRNAHTIPSGTHHPPDFGTSTQCNQPYYCPSSSTRCLASHRRCRTI
jgi:hypothetical protein